MRFPQLLFFKVTQRHILRHSGLIYMVELELGILKAVAKNCSDSSSFIRELCRIIPVRRSKFHAFFVRLRKDATSSSLLIPGADSTPLAVSTPKGCTAAIASATFSGVSPPARIRGGHSVN